jgi:hypothetical protein
MSSIATENVKIGEEMRAQEAERREVRISGEQEDYRRKEAQDILKQLQVALAEGEMPGTEAINDALLKAEEFLVKTARKPDIDPDTRKILEDIAVFTGSVKQVARHKDIGDRLQRIAEETKKALEEVGRPGVSSATAEASQQALQFVESWRPLFELLVSSREFRTLIVDTIDAIRRVFLRHHEGLGREAQKQFISGKSASEIASMVAEESKESFVSQEGKVQVDISDEEVDALQTDLARILIMLSRNPTYRDGVKRFFDLLDLARVQMRKTGRPELSKAAPHARRAQLEAEELIASFSGREAMDEFIENLRRLIIKLEKDPATVNYLKEVKHFVLEESTREDLSEEEVKRHIKEITDKGNSLIDQYRYADEINDFLNSANNLIENIRNDEFVTILKHHAGIIAQDLSYTDASGETHLDIEVINKLRSVIVPVLAESLKYIPIPRISDADEYREYWVDNIVLCGYDVVPDRVRIQIESDSEVSLRDIEVKGAHTRLVITLREIRTEFKDLDFYYKRKTFPEMTEQGRCTLRLGGEGATLVIVFNMDQPSGSAVPTFTDGTAHFNIHKMDIVFDKSTLTHDVLVPMVTSMFKARIQRTIETEVENNLKSLIQSIGARLTEALAQINRPLVTGLEAVRKTVKATEIGQTYDKRREKLE